MQTSDRGRPGRPMRRGSGHHQGTARMQHKRYQNLIHQFYKDLKNGLKETKEYVNELFVPKKEINETELEKPIFNIKFIVCFKFS